MRRKKNPRSVSKWDRVVAKNLVRLMEKHGMSGYRLAPELGVSWQLIQKYRQCKHRMSAGRLKEIAEVLGEPTDQFFVEDKNA